MPFLPGIWAYLAPALLAAVLAAGGAGVLVHKIDAGAIARAEAATTKAQTDSAIHAANEARLSAGLDSCNAGVAAAEQAKRKSDAAAETAEKIAALESARASREASAILAQKPQGDLCKSADEILMRAAQ